MSRPKDVAIKGLLFKLTCGACPEQYDVFNGRGRQVGYVRLRHGCFRVDYPDCLEEQLIAEELEHDDGQFEDDQSRAYWLGRAADAIRARMAKERAERKE